MMKMSRGMLLGTLSRRLSSSPIILSSRYVEIMTVLVIWILTQGIDDRKRLRHGLYRWCNISCPGECLVLRQYSAVKAIICRHMQIIFDIVSLVLYHWTSLLNHVGFQNLWAAEIDVLHADLNIGP
jgi:hypothetical protein